jgi:hypothetical protein
MGLKFSCVELAHSATTVFTRLVGSSWARDPMMIMHVKYKKAKLKCAISLPSTVVRARTQIWSRCSRKQVLYTHTYFSRSGTTYR